MLVYAPEWSLAIASFEVIPPPQKKKVSFSAAEKMKILNSPLKSENGMRGPLLKKKI